MRLIIFGLCTMLAAGVFAAMFLAIWSSRRSSDAGARLRQSAAAEVMWTAIPCLMFAAAAIPAATLIVTAPSTTLAKSAAAPRPPTPTEPCPRASGSSEACARRE